MAPVIKELILALTKHLKPSPHSFGPTVLRILGKLGGRNRQRLHEGQLLKVCSSRDGVPLRRMQVPNNMVFPITSSLVHVQDELAAADPFLVILNASDSVEFSAIRRFPLQLPLGGAVARALASLKSPPTDNHLLLEESFSLVHICIGRLLSPPKPPGAAVEPMHVNDQSGYLCVSVDENPAGPDISKSDEQFEREEALLTQLTLGVIIAAADSNLKEKAVPFLEGLIRHTAFLIAQTPHPLAVLWPRAASRLSARPRAIVDALIAAVGSVYRPEQGEVATTMLRLLLETTEFAGSALHFLYI